MFDIFIRAYLTFVLLQRKVGGCGGDGDDISILFKLNVMALHSRQLIAPNILFLYMQSIAAILVTLDTPTHKESSKHSVPLHFIKYPSYVKMF